MTDQTPEPNISLAIRLEHRATQNAIVRSHRITPASRADDDELDRAAAAALREAEAWKTSAMKVLSEWDEVFDALGRPGEWGASKALESLAEVERMTAAGLRTAAMADDATRQEVEALVADQTPHVCPSCDGTGWVDDEGWSAYEFGPPARTRVESDGLVPCGRCWDWHVRPDERTKPTMVVDGWDSEQEARSVELLTAAYLGRND